MEQSNAKNSEKNPVNSKFEAKFGNQLISTNFDEIKENLSSARFFKTASLIIEKMLNPPSKENKPKLDHQSKGAKINKILSRACDKNLLQKSAEQTLKNNSIANFLSKLSPPAKTSLSEKTDKIENLRLSTLKQVKNNIFYLLNFDYKFSTCHQIEIFQLEQAMYIQNGFKISTRHKPRILNLEPKHNIFYFLDTCDRLLIFDLAQNSQPPKPAHLVSNFQKQLGGLIFVFLWACFNLRFGDSVRI